ncbi:DUF262 domain-containing protein [Micromonospora taraxaci]|uniref:DUF262 domain-containing protein n=1 Tax=Micromonospora taraxaci TaxID=1316803 RepID=UPI0033C63F78
MQGSTPQHYTIADFLKWNDDNELVLNPKFQRGPVWVAPARSYLIDSLLRGYPIPKLLLRTTVDRDNRRTIRDVVDGQQRLRTIIDFANNKLILGSKAGEFAGKRYSDLEDEEKDSFLAYKLTCEQLINASDEDVLEVFIRINSYAVPANAAELRNARYDNAFTDLVKSTVREIGPAWRLGVLSDRERVRMIDQSLVAEVFGFYMDGLREGDEARLNRLYEETKALDVEQLPDAHKVRDVCNAAADLLQDFKGEPIVARPHFLILVACLIYGNDQLPPGRLSFDRVPSPPDILRDRRAAIESLTRLNILLGPDASTEATTSTADFIEARASTQRMKSRQTRFEYFARALAS